MYIFNVMDKYIKVGHHKITRKRPNVWFRVAGRGFNSCVSPLDIKDHRSVSDLELIGWYPNINITQERVFHRSMRGQPGHVCGEWYAYSYLLQVKQKIETDLKGVETAVDPRGKSIALDWAGKRKRRNPNIIRKKKIKKRKNNS